MTTHRQYVRHDAAFARVDTWRLADDGLGLRVRFRIASGPEHVHDLAFDELRLRRHDAETFIATPLKLGEIPGLVELAFCGAPEPVSAALGRVSR